METQEDIGSDADFELGPDDDFLNESDDSTNTTERVDETNDATDETNDETTGTLDDTTDSLDGTLDGTIDSVDGTLDDTTDTVDGTVEETTNEIDETTDGALDNTTDSVDKTVDNTTDVVEETTESVENATEETVDTVGKTTEEPINSTADLLNTTLDGTLESIDAGLSVAVDSGSESTGDDSESVSSNGASADAAESERSGNAAGDSDGNGDGPTVPAPAAAAGLGAVVIGAAGVTALSSGGKSVVTSPEVAQSAAMGARNAATGVRTLLGGFGDKLWKIGAVLRYSRWDDSDPLEHDLRREIYDTVDDAPGIYLSKLDEETDRSLSSLRHHLRILEEENLITTEKVRGKRRYFPVTRGGDDPALIAALDDPATESILTTLADEGPSSGGDLADALDRDPSTVSHHLSRLEEEGVVERERDGRSVVNKLSDSAAMALSDAPAANVDTPAPADD